MIINLFIAQETKNFSIRVRLQSSTDWALPGNPLKGKNANFLSDLGYNEALV